MKMDNPRHSREIEFHLEPYTKLDIWFRDLAEEVERISRKAREDKLNIGGGLTIQHIFKW